jgi:hypothetical protein
MRRSLSVRIAMLVLVASLSTPVFAAPKRDDSPMDEFKSFVSRIAQTINKIFDLGDLIAPPK